MHACAHKEHSAQQLEVTMPPDGTWVLEDIALMHSLSTTV